MRRFKICILCISWALVHVFVGCSPSHYIKKQVNRSEIFRNHHTGIALYDLEKDQLIGGFNEKRYFTPASNIKLFTLYASIKALGDSIPGINYQIVGDSLIFEGTGDPSLLHPDLPTSAVLPFLRSRKEKLFFNADNFNDQRYGPGWAWSDYNDYYQAEKSSLPLYGNIVRFTGDSASARRLKVSPPLWLDSLRADSSVNGIERAEYANSFRYSKRPLPQDLEQDIPVITSPPLTVAILKGVLKREIGVTHQPLGVKKAVFSIPTDSVYKRLMEVSDNMMAEQLMLLYANAHQLPLNTGKAIAHALEHELDDLPDPPVWKDGSGLSRYNLVTPRTMVALLHKLHSSVSQERLFQIIRYKSRSALFKSEGMGNPHFIFAKTGSLSNNFNLSGYLLTKRGKLLAFSIMNNNFVRPSSEIRMEVERLLLGLHRKY